MDALDPVPPTSATDPERGSADAIFREALALDASERSELLRRRCGEDAVLQAELRSLLAWDALATASSLAGVGLPGAVQAEARIPDGTCIDAYVVEAGLGEGGMGVVYRARHATTGRRVALKVVRTSRSWALDGIRREIYALSQLRHPGIVSIVEHGTWEGTPWYAMELVLGTPFRSWIEARHREARAAPILDLFVRLCAPLAAMHGRGIVHRDLKPENLLVREDGEPVIVDFGLAGSWSGCEGRESIDASGPAAGTRRYMAPEQAQGRLSDARADLYALGRMLEEALCVQPALQDAPAELMHLVAELTAPEPSRRIGHAARVAARLRALGASSTGDGTPAPPYLYRPRLVGRQPLLEEAIARLRHDGGSLTLVQGSSGVGKTRFLTELASEAGRRGILVLASECRRDEVQAIDGFRAVLKHVAARCLASGSSEVDDLLGEERTLATYDPLLACHAIPGMRAAPRAQVLTALERLLEHLGAEGPLLVVVDDLQWADELTLAGLCHLHASGSLGRVPLHLLGAFRSEETTPTLDGLCTLHGAASLRLAPLEAADVRSLVEEMLASPPPASFVGYVDGHAEGNPFFVTEYLRAALLEGWLEMDAQGSWVLRDGRDDAVRGTLALPTTLRELLDRRFALLEPAALSVARLASVLGREEEAELLERAVGRPVHAEVAHLVAREVLQVLPSERYRFLHDKIRERLEETTPERVRAAAHGSAAAAIEALAAPRRDERLAALGRHWHAAGERTRARPWLLAAARRVVEISAGSGQAVALYRAYLECVDVPSMDAFTGELELSRLLPLEERRASFARVLRQARLIGSPAALARGLMTVAGMHWDAGRTHRARSLIEAALRKAEDSGDDPLRARAVNVRASFDYQSGDLPGAESSYRRSLDLYRAAGAREESGVVLYNLAILLWQRGALAESRRLYEQAFEVARESGTSYSWVQALSGIGSVDEVQGRLVQARESFEQGLAVARKRKFPEMEGILLAHLARLDLDAGRPREAHDTALLAMTKLSSRWTLALLSCDVAEMALHQGHLREAASTFRGALREADELAYTYARAVALLGLARVARYAGRTARAAVLLEGAGTLLRRLDDRIELATCLVESGRVELCRGGDPSRALEGARELAQHLEVGPESRIARAVAALERAWRAREQGLDLVWGELPDDVPPGILALLRP